MPDPPLDDLLEGFVCPFCLTLQPAGPGTLCYGSFTDTDHPRGVRPIFVEIDENGRPLDSEADRLLKARATYRR